MSTNNTPSDNSDGTIAQTYDGDTHEDDDSPAVFAEHRTGRCESSVVFGEGAEADLTVGGGELTLTLTVDGFEKPEQLLDRDVLTVELTAKDLSEK